MEGKAGGPLRVGYVLSVNSDQNNAHHFLSDDVVHLMEDNKALPSEEEKKQWQWRETDPKATADYSHTDAPEQYLKAEALALPLYLQKLFQDRFTVHTESLELVQRLLIALDGGSKDRKHATRGAALMTDGRASQDAAQLRALMARIKSYDVLLLPSVLLFTDKERGAPFWSVRMRRQLALLCPCVRLADSCSYLALCAQVQRFELIGEERRADCVPADRGRKADGDQRLVSHRAAAIDEAVSASRLHRGGCNGC